MTFPLLLLLVAVRCFAQDAPRLPGTEPMAEHGDLSAAMVEGIDRWLARETERVAVARMQRWRDAANAETWDTFAAAQREQLGRAVGVIDARTSRAIEAIVEPEAPRSIAADEVGVVTQRVRWPVLDGVNGEGLLFQPVAKPRAAIIALPDADELPERCEFARRLAAQGCLVLVPALVDRRDDFSGSDALQRFTNQPHREWIHRQAFEMGRTLIGYEAQKVFAAIDALASMRAKLQLPDSPIGIAGYGEGGLIALHCAALDPRIGATLVSGCFGPRENVFAEPIYRNVFGSVRDFGGAELAALIAPRRLIVEQSRAAEIAGPPPAKDSRKGAAPGAIKTPDIAEVEAEVARANELIAALKNAPPITLVRSADGQPLDHGSDDAIRALLGVEVKKLNNPKLTPLDVPPEFVDARQRRTLRELEQFTQRLVREAERARNETIWTKIKPGAEWDAAQRELRARLWEQVFGKITAEPLAPNPRSRLLFEKEKWSAYEVELDVLPDVFAWAWLLVPRDIKPGERRPVVVCQHGLEGLPEDVVTDDPKAHAFASYKAFAARLADRGFVVFAPHNPYRGGDKFRVLQRRANPLGLSLFSFIIAQHDAQTQWLAGLPFVDPKRIAFYGLSYGGKTAMRVPAVLDRYCLSICSGDFNEWIFKNVSTDARFSYMFSGEYEMPEWNLANVCNYAEMAMLIAPRPFMVERGHNDGVGADEWVGYEYAKVRRGYTKLGVADRTEIEWFDGPHTINGVGTFQFLHKHLAWPAPE
jgi:dienelactone hydrolase